MNEYVKKIFKIVFLENKIQSFEQLINESSFTIESLKDDGFVISKIPSYLKSN
jgi:hypothetical protein